MVCYSEANFYPIINPNSSSSAVAYSAAMTFWGHRMQQIQFSPYGFESVLVSSSQHRWVLQGWGKIHPKITGIWREYFFVYLQSRTGILICCSAYAWFIETKVKASYTWGVKAIPLEYWLKRSRVDKRRWKGGESMSWTTDQGIKTPGFLFLPLTLPAAWRKFANLSVPPSPKWGLLQSCGVVLLFFFL